MTKRKGFSTPFTLYLWTLIERPSWLSDDDIKYEFIHCEKKDSNTKKANATLATCFEVWFTSLFLQEWYSDPICDVVSLDECTESYLYALEI